MNINLIKSISFVAAIVAMCSFNHRHPAEKINDFYTVEDVATPDNIYPEVGGLAFLPNGKLAVCFHRGEVMIYDPKAKTWKQFAQGMHEPLGIMAVNNNELLVMQRPELTRLIDKNKDGVADEYQTVTDAWGLSGNYHEFAFGPVRDKDGNLFMSLNTASNGAGIWNEPRGEVSKAGREGRMYSAVPYRGWVVELTKDGKFVPYALGLRSPNGIGFDNDGNLWVTDNQGDWLGTSKLYNIQKDKFYGHAPSLVWRKGWDPNVVPYNMPVAKLDSMRTKENVLFPHNDISHSPTQMAIIPDNFGPYGGQMVVGEMDYAYLIRVMLEKVKGSYQGAVIKFLDSAGITRGNERIQFTPDGKSLYVGKTELTWVGGRGMQRITYKGGIPMDVLKMNLTDDGFKLTFTKPLALGRGITPNDYTFTNYHYEYHQAYGSNKFDVKPIKVTAVMVSADHKEVTLHLEKMQPGYVYALQIADNVLGEDGSRIANRKVWYTLNNTL